MTGETKETIEEPPTEHVEGVEYRKFDSEDVMKIRSNTILTEVIDGKQVTKIDVGMLQKISVCLGIEKCPWFTDIITAQRGVTKEMFNRRMEVEFRRIPVEMVDKVFKEAQAFNKADFEALDLKKK